ncbi:MAG TPA: DUF885 family protein [Gemmatimonadales bacterium]|nr:DUF885 family protein [Gemmatimonadales bacterium]
MKKPRAGHLGRLALGLLLAGWIANPGLAMGQDSAGTARLRALADRFWTWRAANQPASGDDIPRIVRPRDWVPDWSVTTVAARRKALRGFEGEWRALDTTRWSRSAQVDYRLVGSALARVHWELDVTRGWRRNPLFYLEQTIGALHEDLLRPPPFDTVRTRELVRRLERIPRTIQDGKANLTDAVAPFARLAIAPLTGIRPRLDSVGRALSPLLVGPDAARMPAALARASTALEGYRTWLEQRLPGLPEPTAVGREAYIGFLRRVALVPYSPEQLVAKARQDWSRAVAFETYERQRNQTLPELSLFPTLAAQLAREAEDEVRVRRHLEEKELLSVPAWLRHYRTAPLPPYLEPLGDWGVNDDLTSADRLAEDGVSYRPAPAATLGYFYRATAMDPRPLLVHEGVPGHYMQLAIAWAHEDPIRRHYYDSNSNEGIGFYAEEMMLQAGLFDDSPRVRETIYNFMRLRALRVEADVKLATGEFTIPQAAKYLETNVPMDGGTALQEAAFFAAGPGQAITYEIGKLQILAFLTDARLQLGDHFSLREFHDFVWKNGNVPIALQRWEKLGLDDEVRRLNNVKSER